MLFTFPGCIARLTYPENCRVTDLILHSLSSRKSNKHALHLETKCAVAVYGMDLTVYRIYFVSSYDIYLQCVGGQDYGVYKPMYDDRST